MMTKIEYYAKLDLMDLLNKQGYPTYSKMLEPFHINLTEDPNTIGAMIPGKGVIILNRNLSRDQVSVIVRHELLHEYLDHMLRMQRHVGEQEWEKRTPAMHQRSNIAGDYEISNRGYTAADKKVARAIVLNKQVLKGLVTDIDHPDWIHLSLEEIYDKLAEEMSDEEALAQQSIIQIGQVSSEALEGAEQAQRQAQSIIDDADELLDDADLSDEEREAIQKAMEKAKQAAQEAKKAASSLEQPSEEEVQENDGEVFSGDAERKAKAAQNRIQRCQEILEDAEALKRLGDEAERAIDTEDRDRAIQSANKHKQDPLVQFVDSLNRFIRKEVGYARGSSWAKINKTHIDTGILRPGMSRRATGKIPVINVYFDASGSWTGDPEKWKMGERGLATLNQFVRQGKLKINKWYFSDYEDNGPCVHRTPEAASGGNYDSVRCVVEHIKQTKPDNVVIMTDSDPSDPRTPVTVPGACWFLFVGNVSTAMASSVKGAKLTKELFIRDY